MEEDRFGSGLLLRVPTTRLPGPRPPYSIRRQNKVVAGGDLQRRYHRILCPSPPPPTPTGDLVLAHHLPHAVPHQTHLRDVARVLQRRRPTHLHLLQHWHRQRPQRRLLGRIRSQLQRPRQQWLLRSRPRRRSLQRRRHQLAALGTAVWRRCQSLRRPRSHASLARGLEESRGVERRVGSGAGCGGEMCGRERGEWGQGRGVDGERVGAAAQLQRGGGGDVGDGRGERGVARAFAAGEEGGRGDTWR